MFLLLLCHIKSQTGFGSPEVAWFRIFSKLRIVSTIRCRGKRKITHSLHTLSQEAGTTETGIYGNRYSKSCTCTITPPSLSYMFDSRCDVFVVVARSSLECSSENHSAQCCTWANNHRSQCCDRLNCIGSDAAPQFVYKVGQSIQMLTAVLSRQMMLLPSQQHGPTSWYSRWTNTMRSAMPLDW